MKIVIPGGSGQVGAILARAFHRDGNEVVVLDTGSRKEVKRVKMGRTPEGILMSKDGARAYVAEAGDNRIAIIDLKTLEVAGHLTTGNGPDGMAWSDRR